MQGYDYSQAGLYFLTVCVENKECLFGSVEDGKMILNDYGRIAEEEWLKSAIIRSEIELHAFIIMPNHIHGIVEIVGDTRMDDRPVAHTGINGPKPKSIGSLMGGYKASVTKRINALRDMPGSIIWQRNYYEHIIRNAASYHNIADYILTNPAKWQEDKFYFP